MGRKTKDTIVELLEGIADIGEESIENEYSDISYLSPDKLIDNKLNKGRIITQEDIDNTAINIEIGELQQPLVVKPTSDGIVIISGHKRIRAIKKIFAEGKSIRFNGKEYNDVVPCIIRPINNLYTEILAVLSGNAHKDESEEEKIDRINKSLKLYEQLIIDNRIKGDISRDSFCSAITGYSERTISRYLNKLGKTRNYAQQNSDYDKFYDDLACKLSSKLQTKVSFKGKRMIVSFNNVDDINRILDDLNLGNIVNE